MQTKWPIRLELIPVSQGYFYSPIDGMIVHHRVTPSSTQLLSEERGAVRVKCLAQEHNAVPQPGLEPVPPNPESSTLTTGLPGLPHHTPPPFTMTIIVT